MITVSLFVSLSFPGVANPCPALLRAAGNFSRPPGTANFLATGIWQIFFIRIPAKSALFPVPLLDIPYSCLTENLVTFVDSVSFIPEHCVPKLEKLSFDRWGKSSHPPRLAGLEKVTPSLSLTNQSTQRPQSDSEGAIGSDRQGRLVLIHLRLIP